MRSPRLICIGSNLESHVALRHLIDADVPVQALITRPAESPGGASDYVDLHQFCAEHGIACVDTTNINSQETIERIAAYDPDCLFVLGWNQLLDAELLTLPSVCCIGSHPTLLPFGRGRAPVPWTILQGLRESAVTLFKLELDADAGDIAWQDTFTVQDDWHAMDLYLQIAAFLGKGFTQVYRDITDDNLSFRPQDLTQVTYREKRGPADGWIDFSQDAVVVDRLIRAVSQPFPGAYSYHDGRKIEIWRTLDQEVPAIVGTPGQVLAREGENLLIQAGDRPIWITQLTSNGVSVDLSTLPKGSTFGYRVHDEIHELRQRIANLERNN